jgi:RHS repeat-associated protein
MTNSIGSDHVANAARAIPGRIIAQRKTTSATSSVTYLLADHLGSTVGTVSDAGVTEHMQYYPFGSVRSGHVSTDRGFTGQRREGGSRLGAYFYNARFYATGLAHFMSADTVSTDGLDRYAYVRFNPMRYNDPTGHRLPDCDTACRWQTAWDAFHPDEASGGGCDAACGLQALDEASLAIPRGLEQVFWQAVALGGDPHQWLAELTRAGAVPCHTCDDVLATALSSIPGLVSLGPKLILSIVGREVEENVAKEALSIGARTIFKHGVRHAVEAGADSVAIERAIVLDMAENAVPESGFFKRVVYVEGRQWEYRGFVLPDGTVNVGTYVPLGVP